MSETKDDFIYNYYDYISPIFVYPHVKTYLIDSKRQAVEQVIDLILLIISMGLFALIGFKLFVIIFYFVFVRSSFIIFKFFINLFRCKINISSSLKNAFYNIKKIVKRIFTFNFYLYENRLIGVAMVLFYLLFLASSAVFYVVNNDEISSSEKSNRYMKLFYVHFESMLMIHLLCISFYSCRNMCLDTLSGIILFILLNVVLYMGYLIKEKIENVEGIFENKEPQLIMNSIFNFIFLLINAKSLWNSFFYNRKSKNIII